MSAIGVDLVHGDPVEGADTPARLAEQQASRAAGLPDTPSLASRSRSLARRLAAGVVPYLSHQAHYVGRVGVIGVALLVFGIVCFLSANSPLRQQVAALRSELAQAQQDQLTRGGSGRNLTPDAQLQAFVSGLPARSQLPAITEQIIAQASCGRSCARPGQLRFHRDALRHDCPRAAELPAAGYLPEHPPIRQRDACRDTRCRRRRPEARAQRRSDWRRSRPTSASRCFCGTINERSEEALR